jgi:hypothetical protein
VRPSSKPTHTRHQRPDGDQTSVTILFGHGLFPVSASQGTADHAVGEMSGMRDMAIPAR